MGSWPVVERQVALAWLCRPLLPSAQCSYFLPLASGSGFFRLPALTVDGVTCCHCAAVQALLEAKNMRLLTTPYKGRMLGQWASSRTEETPQATVYPILSASRKDPLSFPEDSFTPLHHGPFLLPSLGWRTIREQRRSQVLPFFNQFRFWIFCCCQGHR